ncbi:MAG: hypothetical protein M1165_01480 [Candidatus Pacearchaeota archaeon]|nr:hypothetical protein [Candidatus Pacearchaeota archaeon]MDE1848996.1 hypothetical protein [Nanoarchaeota archaeon]
MGKLSTPEWIREGFDSKEEYEKKNQRFRTSKNNKKEKGKTFKLRRCPKCGSDNVAVVLGEEEGKNRGEWECRKCGWKGQNVNEEELSEEEFMKYLDTKGVDVA